MSKPEVPPQEWTPAQATRRMFSLRARLLGLKIIKRDERSVTIRIPGWLGETGAEAIRRDLENGARATGQQVSFTRFGRFIRVEAPTTGEDGDGT